MIVLILGFSWVFLFPPNYSDKRFYIIKRANALYKKTYSLAIITTVLKITTWDIKSNESLVAQQGAQNFLINFNLGFHNVAYHHSRKNASWNF